MRMRKVNNKRVLLKLTQHTYSLTPKRNAAYLPGVIAAICAAGTLVAAGIALKNSREQVKKLDVMCVPPVSEQKLCEQLAHAQYARSGSCHARIARNESGQQHDVDRASADRSRLS